MYSGVMMRPSSANSSRDPSVSSSVILNVVKDLDPEKPLFDDRTVMLGLDPSIHERLADDCAAGDKPALAPSFAVIAHRCRRSAPCSYREREIRRTARRRTR